MPRKKVETSIEETLVEYFTHAPIGEAQVLLRIATAVVGQRGPKDDAISQHMRAMGVKPMTSRTPRPKKETTRELPPELPNGHSRPAA